MTAEENKAIVGRYFQEFHHGREHHVLEEIMTPDMLEGTWQLTEMLSGELASSGLLELLGRGERLWHGKHYGGLDPRFG